MHLLVTVTAHGWGHLSQTVPIVAALRARLPRLRVTLRTGLDPALVGARFASAGVAAPAVVRDDTDFGFVMHDALEIDDERSLARYRALHADRGWLERERDALRALRVDAVLSNVGYQPILAAATLGLPAFGASSLNWADLLALRYPDRPGVAPLVAQMRDAYARADALYALQPGLPFDAFAQRVPIAPIGRRGHADRGRLRAALGLPPDGRVMLIAFGGLPMALDTEHWRLPEGWAAVAFTERVVQTPTVVDGRVLGVPFLDLLASCDLLVAKPGYGTFAEAGFAGRDTASVPRDGWPEAPWLEAWLARHARLARIDLPALRAGRFEPVLEAIAAQPARPPADGEGAAQLADDLLARLGAADARAAADAAGPVGESRSAESPTPRWTR